MTDTNQKLREALQAISHIDDSTNHAADASEALDRIGQIASQALALPTAAQVDDINVAESFTSAAPVGELPELPPPVATAAKGPVAFFVKWTETGRPLNGHLDLYTADQMRAYARAALSAGDAVDGPLIDEGSTPVPSLHPVAHIDLGDDFEDVVTVEQAQAYATAAVQQYKEDAQRYRWLRDEAWAGYNKGKGFPHVFTIDGAGNRRTMLAEDALDASIDAAMRKGQL